MEGWGNAEAERRCRAVRASDAGYPERLRHLAHPPEPLFLAGPWDHAGPHAAIVGSRNATEDGLDVARDLARALAERGVAVVSGLARGIDAAAHGGALQAGGPTGAVLGTSLGETYPRHHADLQMKVARSLGLMSEIPPGDSATKGTFASRNRLLAAIADVVVVVQGREGSGALITARDAARLGRPVGAIPWDSREPLGEAPHGLIRSGAATLVRNADDVMELLGAGGATRPAARRMSRVAPINLEDLPPHEAALHRALRERPLPLDHLADAARLSPSELAVALLALELAGLARRMPGGLARRTRGTR